MVVPPEAAGQRLDVFLAGLEPVGSRAAAQRLIDAGQVAVDGTTRRKRHRLAGGEQVHVELEAAPDLADPAAGAGVPFEVTLEDEHLLVVDKPAGVVVHPAPGHPTGTLAQALVNRAAGGAEPWRPGIVHRLDRDTSGLMVVAKSDPVHRALQALIRARELEREYLALVEGRPDARSGTIDAPIGRHPSADWKWAVTAAGKRSVTHYELLEAFRAASLVEIQLETGRTHQIRVHFAALRHPCVGDLTYGADPKLAARLGLTRQWLHAQRLAFDYPGTGKRVSYDSVYPPDLAAALDRLVADSS